MPPLLFLLMIEGLGRMVTKSCKEGLFTCIKFSTNVKLTYFLFVDDVIFFGLEHIEYWKVLHAIMEIFCNET